MTAGARLTDRRAERHGPVTVKEGRLSGSFRGFDPARAAHPTRVLRVEEVVEFFDVSDPDGNTLSFYAELGSEDAAAD